jgi:hypothetical protein
MTKFLRSRKALVATAVAGVGALGVGVAGAVGGIPVAPGPSDEAGSHPAPQATSVTLPDAAYAGSGNAAAAPAAADTSTDVSTDAESEGAPAAGVAPSADSLATALDATGDTPGNTVLNDLVNTAPGPDRGSTISGDARDIAPTPPVPDTAPLPDEATSHMP